MGLFGRKFPYTNFHELNLDWLVDTVLTLKENLVLSVNGQTGEVVLYQNPDVEFPAIDQAAWRIVRTAAGNNLGVHFQNGLMYVLDGNTLDRVYTLNHPPAYPVTSVNGQTGAVTLYPDAGVRLPDVSDNYMNIRRQIDSAGTPEIVGLQVDKTKAERIAGTQRIKIYDEQNTPPYPVTSVNGQTGAVMLAIPFDTPLSASIWNATTASSDHNAGFARDTIDGTISVIFTSEATKAEAYIQFISADQQTEYVKKLLTTDDIPSSSGVVSINGLTGVVTLNGDNVHTSAQDNTALSTTIANIQAILTAQATTIAARTAELKAAENSVSYVVDGKQSAVTIPAGAYFMLVNSEILGRSDGLYTASQAIPATEDIDNTYFTELTPISGGGLNALNSNLNTVHLYDLSSYFTDSRLEYRSIYVRRIGKLCEVIIGFLIPANMTDIINLDITGVLPSDCIPSNQINGVASIRYAQNKTFTFIITSNGNIVVDAIQSNGYGEWCGGTITYIID